MTEAERLQKLLSVLLDTRNFLLVQQPTDMVAVAEVTERIIAVSARLQAELANPTVHQLTPAESAALQKAVNDLEEAIQKSQAVSQILAALTALANL